MIEAFWFCCGFIAALDAVVFYEYLQLRRQNIQLIRKIELRGEK
jgi:hypothetical protein